MKRVVLLINIFFLFFCLNLEAQSWLLFPVGSSGANGFRVGDLDITGDSITIEALITPQPSTTIWYDIATKHTNTGNCNYYLRTRDFAIRTSAGFVSLENPRLLCPDSSYHVAGTYDGDSIKYYVNGVVVASQHWTGILTQNNLITCIGNISTNVGYFEQFIGYLNEVRIWRVARTKAEINANMFNLPNPGGQYGLLAYYQPGVNYTNLQGNTAYNGTLMSSQTSQTANPFFNGNISHNFCCASNPVANITSTGSTTVCDGDSVLLTANSSSQYLWSDGATTRSIYVKASGAYSVTVYDAGGCSGTSATININVISATADITVTGDTIACNGDSILLSSNAGNSYLWSDGHTTQQLYVHLSGQYTVTVSNASGCTAVSAPQNILIGNLTASLTLQGGDSVLCQGDSVEIVASTAPNYLWSTGSTASSIYVSSAGIYSVTVSVNNNCPVISSPSQIVISNPVATISFNGDSTLCPGDSILLAANNGSSFNWSNANVSQQFYANTQGSYIVTVTNADGCKAISLPVNLYLSNAVSNINLIAGDSLLCPGDSVQLSANSGTQYLWSTGSTAASIYANQSGNYQVTVTNTESCSATSAIKAILMSAPVASISTSGTLVICNDDSVLLSANSGTQYLWSSGSSSQSIKVVLPGLYTVTVTNSDGCPKISDSVLVKKSVTDLLIYNSSSNSFCKGDSCLLRTSSIYPISWSNGLTGDSIYVKDDGNYSATVIDSLACVVTSNSFDISTHPLPLVEFALDSLIDCNSYNITFKNHSINEAGSVYDWILGNGNISSDSEPSDEYAAPGNYSVQLTVTSPYGCSSTSSGSFHTYGYVDPLAQFTTLPLKPFLENEKVNFINNSEKAISYFWDFGDNSSSTDENPVHEYKSGGNYHVRLIASNGPDCFSVFESDVLVILYLIPNSFTPNEDYLNDQFPGVNLLLDVSDYQLEIYNRWGQRFFISTDKNKGFQGFTDQGDFCSEGVYVYNISFKTASGYQFNKRGSVSLIR